MTDQPPRAIIPDPVDQIDAIARYVIDWIERVYADVPKSGIIVRDAISLFVGAMQERALVLGGIERGPEPAEGGPDAD